MADRETARADAQTAETIMAAVAAQLRSQVAETVATLRSRLAELANLGVIGRVPQSSGLPRTDPDSSADRYDCRSDRP